MKINTAVILISIIFLCRPVFSQKNVRDSLKAFTINVVQKAMGKGKIKKLAVWDFTDMNKEASSFGSYISEQFSVYAENIDSLQLMDRQNLKSLLKEHKLKSEGYIDKSTIMQLGKFNEVDAVAVGSVIMADKDFQVVVKVIETSFGRTISAEEQFFPIDKKMAAILGIEFNENSNSGEINNSVTSNRGYNRPLNTNEQYNNASTVNKDCEKNNTGDYCFYNSTNTIMKVYIDAFTPAPRIYHIFNLSIYFILKPRESKCIYNYPAINTYNFRVNALDNLRVIVDKGNFLIEKCKSKTYNIK